MGYRWYSQSDRRVVASAINISAPSPSLQVIACESPFTTDVLTTCWIEIDPREFPLLLKVYNSEEWPITATIYGFKRLTSPVGFRLLARRMLPRIRSPGPFQLRA
jgi:hypothetical protein